MATGMSQITKSTILFFHCGPLKKKYTEIKREKITQIGDIANNGKYLSIELKN